MPVDDATPRARQALRTRELVLETARRLFAERGYDATSLQAIADAAGLTKAAVYYYFPTKADLLHAGAEPALADLHRVVERAAGLRTRNARIAAVVDGLLDVVIANRAIIAVINQDPAVRRDKVAHQAGHELAARMLATVYGPSPSPDQRAAFAFVARLPMVIADLTDLSDDALRAALRPLCLRILSGRG